MSSNAAVSFETEF